MQQVFLSYTYSPHPDHTVETDYLRRSVTTVIESMGLRVVTGEDIGGETLTREVEERIDGADALVALLTPWKDRNGNKVPPPWVSDEFARAKVSKPAIRIIHTNLAPAGMFAANEYIAFSTERTSDVLLKLMRTLALWKSQRGRPMEIEIAPDEGSRRFDTSRVKKCEYQLLHNFIESAWRIATVWPQPGAIYAYIPGVPDQAKLRLRLQYQNEVWQSDYSSPVGRVQLSRTQP
jgi:hypothetical protein